MLHLDPIISGNRNSGNRVDYICGVDETGQSKIR
jgi:hypothetical protein